MEYLAASLLDMDWHTLASTTARGREQRLKSNRSRRCAFSRRSSHATGARISRISGAAAITAGYYSYIWAAVLDADAFEAFKEHGLFDRTTAKAFEEFVLAKGATDEAMKQYIKFRGRKPAIEPLLKRRGLM